MNIIEIKRVCDIRIKNKHNGVVFPLQDILKISYENGKNRVLDLFSEKDITDIDYFEIVESDKTSEIVYFKDTNLRGA